MSDVMKRIEWYTRKFEVVRSHIPYAYQMGIELIEYVKKQDSTIKQQQELLKQLVGEETLFQQGEYETEMTRLYKKVEQLHAENERLEKFIENLQVVHFTELQREKAENERYREALEFYAEGKHHKELEFYDHDEILDQGKTARKALEGSHE